MTQKRLFIIHGWTGNNNQDWFPWAITQFTQKGFDVRAPQLPNTDYPRIDAWIHAIDEAVGNQLYPTDIFIGHSLGCQAILRYLDTKPGDTKIDKVILVAGAHYLSPAALPEPLDEVIFKPWRETPINYVKIKNMANSFTAVFSSNDPWVMLELTQQLYQEKLNARSVVLDNQGHFMKESGNVTSIPLLLELI